MFLEGYMDKYLLVEKNIMKNENIVFSDPIDLQKIYEQGYFYTTLPMSLSLSGLRAINRLKFKKEKVPLFRYCVNLSILSGESLSPIFKLIVDSIYSQSLSVLSMFNVEEHPLSTKLSTFKLLDGDKMPWVKVSSKQAVLGFYIIFKEEGRVESDYPVFEFGQVSYNETGSVIQREMLEQIKLRDESLVIFYDPCNFNVTHRISNIFNETPVTLLHGIMGDIDHV